MGSDSHAPEPAPAPATSSITPDVPKQVCALPSLTAAGLGYMGFLSMATPPIAAGFFGTAGACAVLGFPKTKLADDTPLIGAGLFAGVGAYALKMAPKNAAGGMVAAACGLLTVASLNNVGLSSADAKKAGGEDLQAQIIDAAAHIEAQKAAIAARI